MEGKSTERGRKKSKSPERKIRDGSSGSSKSRSRSPSKGKKGKKGKKGRVSKLASEWSRAELMEKLQPFATFQLDLSSGSGKLEISNKRIMADETTILLEVFRRYAEVQHITMRKCFLTDVEFAVLVAAMENLRHLKTLNLITNALTIESVQRIIDLFAGKERKLITLDLRENNIGEVEGHMLYSAFFQADFLNGINLAGTRIRRGPTCHILNLHDSKVKLSEVAIVGSLLQRELHLTDLVLSKNYIDAVTMKALVEVLRKCSHISTVDLSFNPLTNNAKDMKGLEMFVNLLREKKNILNAKLEVRFVFKC